MSTPLVLLAASGLAREVVAALDAAGHDRPIGYLDDDPALSGSSVGALPVLGRIHAAPRFSDCRFVVCAGSGRARRSIVSRLDELGVGADRYESVLHPTAVVPSSSRIGAGSIVLANTVMTADVSVGAHCVAMPTVVLTHDCSLGDYVTLCAGTVLGGNVTVGEAAYLGMNSSVRENLTIGADATLGMGSVALSSVPRGQTWVGCPAAQMSAVKKDVA